MTSPESGTPYTQEDLEAAREPIGKLVKSLHRLGMESAATVIAKLFATARLAFERAPAEGRLRDAHALEDCKALDRIWTVLGPRSADEQKMEISQIVASRLAALPSPVSEPTEQTVTRFEVIDHRAMGEGEARGETRGRVFTLYSDAPFSINLSRQDQGRTLKVFLDDVARRPSEAP